jgi:hypothetical protein
MAHLREADIGIRIKLLIQIISTIGMYTSYLQNFITFTVQY